MQCKTYNTALPDAIKLKDMDALNEIYQNCEEEEVKDSARRTLQMLNGQ